MDAVSGIGECNKELIKIFEKKKIPYILAFNKSDLIEKSRLVEKNAVYVSATTGEGIQSLKELLGEYGKILQNPKFFVRDLLSAGDIVVLVTPIDETLPKDD